MLRDVWVPADPVTLENGAMMCMSAAPHRDGTLYKPNVFISQAPLPGSEGADLPDIENNLDDYDIVHFDVEPGDLLSTTTGPFMAPWNEELHEVRRAASIRYCGDDIRFKASAPQQLHHTLPFEHKDSAERYPDFPVVWERHAPGPDARRVWRRKPRRANCPGPGRVRRRPPGSWWRLQGEAAPDPEESGIEGDCRPRSHCELPAVVAISAAFAGLRDHRGLQHDLHTFVHYLKLAEAELTDVASEATEMDEMIRSPSPRTH